MFAITSKTENNKENENLTWRSVLYGAEGRKENKESNLG